MAILAPMASFGLAAMGLACVLTAVGGKFLGGYVAMVGMAYYTGSSVGVSKVQSVVAEHSKVRNLLMLRPSRSYEPSRYLEIRVIVMHILC
jgi:hypothetical protein